MTRNPHAGEAVVDSDSTIAAALEDVSIPALLCSLVHMTGDPAWIRGDIRPRVAVSLDIQCGIPAEERTEVRHRALSAIEAYRDGGSVPHELSRELLLEMMSFLGCRPVHEGRLAELFFDDLQFEGGDTGAMGWGDEIPEEVKAASPVVVIGCGLAGILAGIRLKQVGLPFIIVEKNPGPGGTWWENRYPGPGSMSGATSTVTPSSPPTIGASSTASSRNCGSISRPSSTSTTWARTADSTPPSPSWNGTTGAPTGVSASERLTAQRRS
jgi:4-hydroxyacetophenone monooxygenase